MLLARSCRRAARGAGRSAATRVGVDVRDARRRAARRRRSARAGSAPTRASPLAYTRDRRRARRRRRRHACAAEAALAVGERAAQNRRRPPRPSAPRRTNTFERDSSAAFTSNDGFSVVAPMRTMSPASTRGRKASCCALLKRWISSMKRIVRRPVARRIRSASVITSRISLMPESTALNETKRACVVSAMMPRERRLAGAGRAPEDDRLQQVALDRLAQRPAGREQLLLADELVEACAAACARRAARGAAGTAGGRRFVGKQRVHQA